MEKSHKRYKEFCSGIKTSFLFELPSLIVIYTILNSHSNRVITTLVILSAFTIIESIPIIKQKEKKGYTSPFLSGFFGGIISLALLFRLIVF